MTNYYLDVEDAKTMCDLIKQAEYSTTDTIEISIVDNTIVYSDSTVTTISSLIPNSDTITIILDPARNTDQQVLKCIGLIRGYMEDFDTSQTNEIPIKLTIKTSCCDNSCDDC